MMYGFILIISLLFYINHSQAQMPETNIFLINYTKEDENIKASEIIEISPKEGYNNQPSFSPDCKKIYYTSNIADTAQTDLYSYDVANRTSKKITNTNLSEYSPVIRPGLAYALSHVRVETDKKQNLRTYSEDYSTPINVVPCSDSIGYYIWSDSMTMGLIILNNGLEFHTYKVGDYQTSLISKNVGRFISFDRKSDSYLFLNKDSTLKSINYFNTNTGTIDKRIQAMTDCEDYAIDNNSVIYGSKNGKIYVYRDNKWEQTADLTKQTGPFYRMTFCNCGKHLCVVSYNGKRP